MHIVYSSSFFAGEKMRGKAHADLEMMCILTPPPSFSPFSLDTKSPNKMGKLNYTRAHRVIEGSPICFKIHLIIRCVYDSYTRRVKESHVVYALYYNYTGALRGLLGLRAKICCPLPPHIIIWDACQENPLPP